MEEWIEVEYKDQQTFRAWKNLHNFTGKRLWIHPAHVLRVVPHTGPSVRERLDRAAVAAAAEPEIQPENPENVSPTPPTLDTPGTPAHTPGRYLGYIRVLYCTVPALHSPSVTFSHL